MVDFIAQLSAPAELQFPQNRPGRQPIARTLLDPQHIHFYTHDIIALHSLFDTWQQLTCMLAVPD